MLLPTPPSRFEYREIALLAEMTRDDDKGPVRVIRRNDSTDCSETSREWMREREEGKIGSIYARVHVRVRVWYTRL